MLTQHYSAAECGAMKLLQRGTFCTVGGMQAGAATVGGSEKMTPQNK